MNATFPDFPDYALLHENGLLLSESDFASIVQEISKGVHDARKFLKTDADAGQKFVITDEIGAIGYSAKADAINIRMDYLNLVATNSTLIAYRDQLVCFVPDKFYMILKYLHWMRLFGIEETVHYYQRHGNSLLHAAFPENFPAELSPKSLLLSDIEVEARSMVDNILIAGGEQPIWKPVDAFLKSNYQQYYNKPLAEIAALPKPDLPISFEMENLIF
jgi:hypothetical protein